MRSLAVIVHRWVGLAMAGFLIIAGLTGVLLVWYHELDTALNPGTMRVQAPASGAVRLDPLALRESVEAAFPQAEAHWVPLRTGDPAQAAVFWVAGADDGAGGHAALGFDEVFVDPYTGQVLGTRMWGDLAQGARNLMPFVYRLHQSLALGTVGTWTFGIIALLWSIDCFVGAYLTLPARAASGQPRRGWWRRWAPSWRLRPGAGPYKLNFDLHRAGGLWTWAAMFVLAWSSVAFNLYDPVYRPVMGAFFDMRPDPRVGMPRLDQEIPVPPMGWEAGLRVSRQHMAALAERKGVRILSEDRLSYDPHRAVFRLEVFSDRDVSEQRGRTAVFIDARSGALRAHRFPTGEAAGDTLTTWLLTLHMAHLWGMPFRIFMSVMGMLVVLLSLTGIYIWWRKRLARRHRNGAHPIAAGA